MVQSAVAFAASGVGCRQRIHQHHSQLRLCAWTGQSPRPHGVRRPSGRRSRSVVAAVSSSSTEHGAVLSGKAAIPSEAVLVTDGADRKGLQRLFKTAFATSKVQLALAAIALLVGTASGVCIPLLVGRSVSVLAAMGLSQSTTATFEKFLRLLWITVAAMVLDCCATWVYVRNMVEVIDRTVSALRRKLFKSVSSLDATFFDQIPRGRLTSALTVDARQVRETLWANLSRDRGFRAILESLSAVVLVFFVSRKVGMLYVTVIPFAAAMSVMSSLALGALAQRESAAASISSDKVGEVLGSTRTVMAFGTGDREYRKFSDTLEQDDLISKRARGRRALGDFINRFGIYGNIVAVVGFGAYWVSKGFITLATFLSVQSYIWLLNFAFQGVCISLSDMQKVTGALRRIFGILDAARAHGRSPTFTADEKFENVAGLVEFRNVHFAYPTRPNLNVLDDFHLVLEPGRTTALVGRSGSGKSTIASLLSRFYTPRDGSILLDTVPVDTLSRPWFAEQISLVSQDPVMFAGTVREAIAYGAPDRRSPVSDDEIVHAAKLANAHDFVMALPDGYNTQVGARGSALSGGQRQRIAIARAVLRDSRILILDEATSALDAESEKLVQDALENLMKTKTCLVIAHRLSTIKGADTIVLIGPKGAVLEKGNYESLMNANGAFSELMKTQTTAFVGE